MEVMWRVVLTVSLLCWDLCSSAITCKDKNGGEVDWYILYKMPKLKNKRTGLEYSYIDSENRHESLNDITDKEGVLANTLGPLFSPPTKFGFISYNDQFKNRNAGRQFGHSKGIVMMDNTTGVWLLHSTPQFPKERKKDAFWPDNGATNAQTFICVTFQYSQFQEIGIHLQYIRAYPFDHKIPNDFHPELQTVVDKKDINPKDNPFRDQKLISKGNQEFRSFAKYSTATTNVKDIYFHIASNLESDLSAQTWREEQDEDSPCKDNSAGQREVKAIISLKTDKYTWKKGCDHSKWCVTEDQNRQWTCIADMNRQKTQHRRPGGALCIPGERVWKVFRGFIDETDNCPPNKKRKIDQNCS